MQKEAFFILPAFGGGKYTTKRRGGFRGEAGYDYLAGVLPLPSVGFSVGNDKMEVGLSGPLPGISFTSGRDKDSYGWDNDFTRSLPKVIADKIQGRTKYDHFNDEVFRRVIRNLERETSKFEQDDNKSKNKVALLNQLGNNNKINMNTDVLTAFTKRANELGISDDQALQGLQGLQGGQPPAPAQPEVDPAAAMGGDMGGGQDLAPEQIQELIAILTQMLQEQDGGGQIDPTKMASEKLAVDTSDYISSFLKTAFDHGATIDQACIAYNSVKNMIKNEFPVLDKQAEHFDGFYKAAKHNGIADDNLIYAAYEDFLSKTQNK